MGKTKISWSEMTWNPVTGCSKVSSGCDNCYAEKIALTNRRNTFPRGFAVTLRPERLDDPKRWRQPRLVFVNSMSDLFHREIPPDYLRQIWTTMLDANQHTYQILTKRPHRMQRLVADLDLPLAPHIWLGVSAENQELADSRIPPLLDTRPVVAFVSAEPLLDTLNLRAYLRPGGLQWVIVGGESGNVRRPMRYEWARSLRDQCQAANIPFFYKQGNDRYSGRDKVLDGREWTEYPEPVTTARLF